MNTAGFGTLSGDRALATCTVDTGESLTELDSAGRRVENTWVDSLTQLHASLRNFAAPPGAFAAAFPETTEADLTAVLLDALAEAHLAGLLLEVDATDDGTLTVPITRGQGALIALFAGIRLVRARLLNATSRRRYEAGGALFEEETPTNLLRDILKDLSTQRDRITTELQRAGAPSAFHMADQYGARLGLWSAVGGAYERAGGW